MQFSIILNNLNYSNYNSINALNASFVLAHNITAGNMVSVGLRINVNTLSAQVWHSACIICSGGSDSPEVICITGSARSED